MDKDIIFQITSWYCCDCDYETEDDDEDESNITRYLIKIFGVDKNGHSVSANLLQFTPYFFIKYPFQINKATTERIREFLTSKLPYNLRSSLLNVKCLKKQDFLGFHNNEKFNFMRFSFKNQAAWRAAIRIFQKAVQIPGLPMCKFKLYESNVEPFLRMMHIRDIDPCGWIKIKKGYDMNTEIYPTNCDIDINTNWNNVERYACEDMAPMRIVSFDIECISSHGDFPVAKKDYKKVANELFQYYSKNPDMTNMAKEIISVFKKDEDGLFSKVYTKHKFDFLDVEKRVKKNIDDISAIIRGKLMYVKDILKSPGQFKMSNDEIIKTLTQKLSMMGLPELEGDPIIQIGTTMHIYGEKQCSKKHILSLGSCDDIEDVEVEVCETETDLLLKWRDLIVDKWNPDVITGYNIFGFDFSYMYDRSKELGIEHEFCKLGKIVGETCPYMEKNLSSSALGDNLLKYVDMNGRVLIDMMKVVQRDHKLDSYKLDNVAHHFMNMNKNDVSPNDIFRLYRGNAADRKVIAQYCVQDCALCNHLMIKLETLANNIGMSNVCFVPLSYIFMRGQSVKIFSLVAKQCREDDFVIPTISKAYNEEPEEEDDEGYEGAIVLPPKTGIYIEDPVSVLDYASLYPSSMISENLSHDTLVMDEKYNNLPGVEYLDIKYDIYEGSGDKKVKIGEKVSRFVQFPNNEKGVLPRILMKLLRQRKETRKKIEFVTLTFKDGSSISGLIKEKDGKIIVNGADGKMIGEYNKEDIVEENETYNEFQKAVLDGLQLAYKVTANSLYGQCGAKTSPIYLKDVAASTTATGRKMIMLAQDFILKNYEGSEIVYGDTDSLFVKFNPKDENGNPITGQAAIPLCRELGIKASNEIKKIIKPPHDLEWEKLFWPFILLSKKRYIANKYEYDDYKYKQSSMGVVLKRRDNANIVKTIYGGIINKILDDQDIKKSLCFLQESLENLVSGKYPLEELVITKSLKGDYKDPTRIAHKVLADRMKARDPGSAPQVNDRIPYVYVETEEKKGEKMLQGDKIEHIDYVRKNKLKPDYNFYLTNQVMRPILQIYALILEDLPGYKKGKTYFKDLYNKILIDKEGDETKAKDRWQDLREDEVKKILFDPTLIKLENKKKGNREITDFFKLVK